MIIRNEQCNLQRSIPARRARAGSRYMIANGFVTTLAFLLAVHAVCAFLAGQVAVFAVPAS